MTSSDNRFCSHGGTCEENMAATGGSFCANTGEAETSAKLETARRNVYRLQTSGVRLCEALRKIADGCPAPALVASKALAHKEPDPDWRALASTRPEAGGEVELNLDGLAIIKGREVIATCADDATAFALFNELERRAALQQEPKQ